jgi:hypothetical protein
VNLTRLVRIRKEEEEEEEEEELDDMRRNRETANQKREERKRTEELKRRSHRADTELVRQFSTDWGRFNSGDMITDDVIIERNDRRGFTQMQDDYKPSLPPDDVTVPLPSFHGRWFGGGGGRQLPSVPPQQIGFGMLPAAPSALFQYTGATSSMAQLWGPPAVAPLGDFFGLGAASSSSSTDRPSRAAQNMRHAQISFSPGPRAPEQREPVRVGVDSRAPELRQSHQDVYSAFYRDGKIDWNSLAPLFNVMSNGPRIYYRNAFAEIKANNVQYRFDADKRAAQNALIAEIQRIYGAQALAYQQSHGG